MMFLQFFAWGSWFVTLKLALNTNDLGAFVGGAFESAPIAAIFAPLFLGLIADRLFPSEKVMGTLMIIGSLLMGYIAYIAPTRLFTRPTHRKSHDRIHVLLHAHSRSGQYHYL